MIPFLSGDSEHLLLDILWGVMFICIGILFEYLKISERIAKRMSKKIRWWEVHKIERWVDNIAGFIGFILAAIIYILY